VDALYLPVYREVLAAAEDPGWRHERARELADVGSSLVRLLAMADRRSALPES
jgi:hypothetical protein